MPEQNVSKSQTHDKLLAEWFWVDRWTGSTAFGLPQEARGVYREMLSQAWRRGAQLPNDHAAIRRITGTTEEEWARSWPQIAPFWRESGGFLVNDTQRNVYADAKARLERASARGRSGGLARARALLKQNTSSAQAAPKQVLKDKPPSLSLKDQKHKSARWKVGTWDVTPPRHDRIMDALGDRANDVDWDRAYGWANTVVQRDGMPRSVFDFCIAVAREQLNEGPRLPTVAELDAKAPPPISTWTPEQRDEARRIVKAATAGSR